MSTTTATTMPTTPSSSSSPSRLKRSIRGVRNLLTFRHLDRWHDEPVVPCNTTQHTNLQTDDIGNNNNSTTGLPSVAVTLTADVCGKAAMDLLTVVHHQQPPRFSAHESPLTLSSLGDMKGYVHYEPKRGVVGLGNRPPGNTKHTRSIWLTLEQYAWVVRRLQEEEELLVQQQQNRWIQQQHHQHHSYRHIANSNTISPMLGILRHYDPKKHPSPSSSPQQRISSSPISATRRLSRLVLLHPATQRITHSIRGGEPVLLLPKTLLLHAAAYIPMTKPLPPVIVTHENSHQRLYHHNTSINSRSSTGSSSSSSSYGNNNTAPPTPFQPIPSDLQSRLKRYVQLASMATHQLTLDTACHELVCLRCRTIMHDEALSYLRTIRHERRQTFDTYPARSSLAPIRPSSAILSSTAALSSNSSSIHTTSAGIGTSSEYSYQDGYVAVDDERQEIIVTFPGTTTGNDHHSSLYTSSFTTVPWHEEEGIYTPDDDQHGRNDGSGMMDKHTWRHGSQYQYQQYHRPWVLEAAAVAWRRCEMTVATALMRLCRITPCHYRVVIIGHALGGGKRLLCSEWDTMKLISFDVIYVYSCSCIMCIFIGNDWITCGSSRDTMCYWSTTHWQPCIRQSSCRTC